MEVSCTSCPARFAIPDDKVRGRRVRIKCKRCGAAIIVDGTTLPSKKPPAPVGLARAPAPTPPMPPEPAPVSSPLDKTLVVESPPSEQPSTRKRQTTGSKPGAATGQASAAVPPPPARQERPAPPATEATPSSRTKVWAALDGAGKSSGAWREPASAGPTAAKRTLLGGLEAPPSAPRPASVPRPASAPRPAHGPPSAGAAKPFSSKRTMLGIAPPAAQQEPPAAVSTTDVAELEPEWTVALTDDQHEEMRTQEVVELYARGSIDHETFIWADGMEDWKQPWEIPMIAAALRERGLSQPSADEVAPEPEEPDEDDATIVASVRFGLPPSSRGSVPSGVWLEPGRGAEAAEEPKIGFDDVTVSLDGAQARKLLSSASEANASDSEPPFSEDTLTRVNRDFEQAPESSRLDAGVDDLLASMEDTTTSMGGFEAAARPLTSVVDFDEAETTIEQGLLPQEALPQPPPVTMPSPIATVQMPDAGLFQGLDVPQGVGRAEPLDSLLGPAHPRAAPAPAYGPAALPEAKPKKSRAVGCFLVLFLLAAALAGAGAASYYFKQPPEFYLPDGRPKLPKLPFSI